MRASYINLRQRISLYIEKSVSFPSFIAFVYYGKHITLPSRVQKVSFDGFLSRGFVEFGEKHSGADEAVWA